jgi:glycosyl transferase family 25
MIWDKIEKVIYINLEERMDKRGNIEKEFSFIPNDKLIRFSAIKHEHGHIGCSESHIECLKLAIANNWKNVLIIEDDAIFNNYEDGILKLEKLLNIDYDTIVLGGTHVNYNEETMKLYNSQSCVAYLVSQNYYLTLLNNYEEGLTQLKNTFTYDEYCIDQYWKRLQNQDNWYVIKPPLIIQKPGISNIENRYVDYTEIF